eukprot:1841977-Amphidinium_carterae.1
MPCLWKVWLAAVAILAAAWSLQGGQPCGGILDGFEQLPPEEAQNIQATCDRYRERFPPTLQRYAETIKHGCKKHIESTLWLMLFSGLERDPLQQTLWEDTVKKYSKTLALDRRVNLRFSYVPDKNNTKQEKFRARLEQISFEELESLYVNHPGHNRTFLHASCIDRAAPLPVKDCDSFYFFNFAWYSENGCDGRATRCGPNAAVVAILVDGDGTLQRVQYQNYDGSFVSYASVDDVALTHQSHDQWKHIVSFDKAGSAVHGGECYRLYVIHVPLECYGPYVPSSGSSDWMKYLMQG